MTDDLIKELRSYPAHYVAAHRAADALEKAERNMNAREYHNIYLEDQLLKLGQANETMRDHISKQQLDIITLGQEVGRLREALTQIEKWTAEMTNNKTSYVGTMIHNKARAALEKHGEE